MEIMVTPSFTSCVEGVTHMSGASSHLTVQTQHCVTSSRRPPPDFLLSFTQWLPPPVPMSASSTDPEL